MQTYPVSSARRPLFCRSLQVVPSPALPMQNLLLLSFCYFRRSSYMQVAYINDVPLFYSDRDGHWFPTLRILHQYPDMMPKLRTDKGAIKFVLSGANIMCPGLTSPGATIHDEVTALAGFGSLQVPVPKEQLWSPTPAVSSSSNSNSSSTGRRSTA
eukprot:GHUV01023085.1.p1 GENE.GHUV01023085.1~~GHUV01023085.1.p1  ORF type:complete len:156 (-),score=16.38 GHUV01023085.1:42-509(-)